MERGSSKPGTRLDEEMKREVRGTVQGVTGGRAEEWKMAEPAGEDQPETNRVPNVGEHTALSRFGSSGDQCHSRRWCRTRPTPRVWR